MIVTGRCGGCGRQIGLEPGELGKMKPPTQCRVCSRPFGRNDVLEQLQAIFAGKPPENMKLATTTTPPILRSSTNAFARRWRLVFSRWPCCGGIPAAITRMESFV